MGGIKMILRYWLRSKLKNKILKKDTGDELHKVVNACLQFDRVVNAAEAMSKVVEKAKEALKRVGQESKLNAFRARKYGVIEDMTSS
jgi:SpoVK/Ycf46/Vps4 family AAA+-type ATPase